MIEFGINEDGTISKVTILIEICARYNVQTIQVVMSMQPWKVSIKMV